MENREQFLREAAEELKNIGYGMYYDYGKLSLEHAKQLMYSDIELTVELFKREFINQDFELAHCYTELIKSIEFINSIDVLDIDSMESLKDKGRLSNETMEKIWKTNLPQTVTEATNSFIQEHVDSLLNSKCYDTIINILSNRYYRLDKSTDILKKVISHFVNTYNCRYLEKVRYDGGLYYLKHGKKIDSLKIEFLKPFLEKLEKTDELLYKSLLRSTIKSRLFAFSPRATSAASDPLKDYVVDHIFHYAEIIKSFVYNYCIKRDFDGTVFFDVSPTILFKIVEKNMISALLEAIHNIINDLIAKEDWVVKHYEEKKKEDTVLYGEKYVEEKIPFLTGDNFFYTSIIFNISAFNEDDFIKIEEIANTVKQALLREKNEEKVENDSAINDINEFLCILKSDSKTKRSDIVRWCSWGSDSLNNAIIFGHEDVVFYLTELLIKHYKKTEIKCKQTNSLNTKERILSDSFCEFLEGSISLTSHPSELMNSILRFNRFDVLEELLKSFPDESEQIETIYSDLLYDIKHYFGHDVDSYYASLSSLVTNSELSDTHKLQILSHIINDIHKEILNISEDTYSELFSFIWDFFIFLSDMKIVEIDDEMDEANRFMNVLLFIVSVRIDDVLSYERVSDDRRKQINDDYLYFLDRYEPSESSFEEYDRYRLEDRMKAYSQMVEEYDDIDHPLLSMKLKITKNLFFAVNTRYQADVRARKDNEIRIAERNRIMANLSHTIKNMIGTIIDPLENMRSSNEYKPVAIDNAIRGANLVRNLVNAMNQSFTGSLDDFAYDVSHATYEGSTSIYDMIVDSLGYAASTMFDGKYFHKFMKNYYPEKAVYRQAKRSWESLPAQKSLAQMESFFSEYMLTPHITIDDATECIIGNDHGSSLKLLILIQEIVLNAVKYASFIQRDNRQLTISFTADDSTVTLLLSNSYDPQNRVKSTGLGNEIIKNFAGILETKPVITQGDTEYTIEIPIQNLWRKG